VLFELAVTKTWLGQVIVGLALVGRGSYRGVVEFVRDLLGIAVSTGCVHDVLQAATRQASASCKCAVRSTTARSVRGSATSLSQSPTQVRN
jgi:hypothetical protein